MKNNHELVSSSAMQTPEKLYQALEDAVRRRDLVDMRRMSALLKKR